MSSKPPEGPDQTASVIEKAPVRESERALRKLRLLIRLKTRKSEDPDAASDNIKVTLGELKIKPEEEEKDPS